MMMLKYLLDTDAPVRFPGVDAPRHQFADPVAPIRLALEQERDVSRRIRELFALARAEGDYLSEHFTQSS
jgi:ferritin